MSKYRVINHKQEGAYNIFQVQRREWFYLIPYWQPLRSFDSLIEAQDYIKRSKVKATQTIVHEE